MPSSLKKRIISGLGANAFGQVITIAIQFISVTLFLKYWDISTYGEWLVLTAIPSYLSMADIGVVLVSSNEMTMATGKGAYKKANQIFQSAFAFVLIVFVVLLLIIIPISIWFPFPNSSKDYHIAVFILSIGILFSLFNGLSDAVFKATGRYPEGAFYINSLRIIEWGGSMVGLIIVGSFSAVAIYGVTLRIIGIFIIAFLASRGGHGITWGIKNAGIVEIRKIVKPALSFMMFPVSNALSLQGVTILTGEILGPSTVAIFNTYRTISRVTVQANAIWSHALWAEFSRIFGSGDIGATRSIYRKSFFIGVIISIFLCFFMYIFSPYILSIWTNKKIIFNQELMVFMLLYAVIASIAHVPRTFLLATNQHSNLANWTLVSAVLVIGLSLILGNRMGLIGFCIAMIISELLLLLVCMYSLKPSSFSER